MQKSTNVPNKPITVYKQVRTELRYDIHCESTYSSNLQAAKHEQSCPQRVLPTCLGRILQLFTLCGTNVQYRNAPRVLALFQDEEKNPSVVTPVLLSLNSLGDIQWSNNINLFARLLTWCSALQSTEIYDSFYSVAAGAWRHSQLSKRISSREPCH